MLDAILNKLNQLPKYLWIFFGISSITTPLGLCYLLINSGNLVYKTPDVEIKFEGKDKANKLSNNTAYSNRALNNKLLTLEKDIRQLKNEDSNPAELIEKVEQSFNELKPTATEAIENSEELTEFVESAIAK